MTRKEISFHILDTMILDTRLTPDSDSSNLASNWASKAQF